MLVFKLITQQIKNIFGKSGLELFFELFKIEVSNYFKSNFCKIKFLIYKNTSNLNELNLKLIQKLCEKLKTKIVCPNFKENVKS